MQNTKSCGKIVTKDGFILCPICKRQKVLRVLPDTSGKRIPIYCRNCKQESIIDIDQSSLSRRA